MNEAQFVQEIDTSKPTGGVFYKYRKKALKKLRRKGKKMVYRWIKDGLIKLPNWDNFINGQ
jgi:hypothetical protein